MVNKYVLLCEISSATAHLTWQTNAPSALQTSRKLSWDQYKQIRAQLGRKSQKAKEALATFLAINKKLSNFSISSQAAYEKSLLLNLLRIPSYSTDTHMSTIRK